MTNKMAIFQSQFNYLFRIVSEDKKNYFLLKNFPRSRM